MMKAKRQRILDNAYTVLDALIEPIAAGRIPSGVDRKALYEAVEHMSAVIWNLSNIEEPEDELTDEEVEDGIL